MNAKIYFLYTDHPVEIRSCEYEYAENAIRSWLGKSPGIHQIQDILVVPETQRKSWMFVWRKMIDEEVAYEQRKRDEAERAEYERLSKKFGANKTQNI